MADVRWLDEHEQTVWRGFLQMQRDLQARLNRQLQQDAGLSGADYEVLVNLSEAPSTRLRAFELADSMQWEKSRLSHHLTRMERRGLIRREECETDARGAFILLTADGRRAIKKAAPLHVGEVRRAFIDVLSAEQLDALDGITRAVLDQLGEASPDPA